MSIDEFKALSHENKVHIIMKKGIPVGTLFENGIQTVLYSLNEHFIEVTLNPSNSEIETIVHVKGLRLDRYLMQVKLLL